MTATRPRRLPRWHARFVRALGLLLPDDQREWADALAAEVNATPTGSDCTTLALSGSAGLVSIAIARGFTQWRSALPALVSALGLGVLVAVVDLSSDSRWPLRASVIGSALLCGAIAPRFALLSGTLIGSAIVIATAIAGFPAPYAHDRGDVWIPLFPSIALALLAAQVAKRLRHRA